MRTIRNGWDKKLTGSGFEQFVLRIEGTYRWYFNIDRSYNKLRFAKFWQVLSENPFFEDITHHWELEVLAVHPAYQRQGLGSTLLSWGMVQASRHQLPVVVAATHNGKHLYRKHGFKECGRIDLPDSAFSWTAMVRYPGQARPPDMDPSPWLSSVLCHTSFRCVDC